MTHHPCSYQSWLSPYMDGELAPEQTDRLKAHLAECDVCRTEFQALQRLSDRISALTEIDPSSEFDRTFWARVAEKEKRQAEPVFWRRFLKAWRPLAAGAATVFFLVAGTWWLRQSAPWQPSEDVLIAAHLELLEAYEIVTHLELLENWEDINTLEAVDSG